MADEQVKTDSSEVKTDSSEQPDRVCFARARLTVAVLFTNVLNVGYGCLAGYLSPALPDINEHPNPFRLSEQQQSWLGSLIALGAAFAGLVCGATCDYFGRKLTMMLSALLCVVALTLLTTATDASRMYAGVFIAGFGSMQNFVASILYLSELSPTSLRGRITTSANLSYALGIVVVYTAGAYLSWNWLAIFVASFYALPPLALAFLPESPRWLLLKGRRQEALTSFSWFHGPEKAEQIDEEVRIIEASLMTAHQDDSSSSSSSSSSYSSSWKALLEYDNLRPLATVCFLFAVQAFSGVIVLQVFTVTIFEMVGFDWNPNLQSVVTGLFFFLGSIVCPLVVDRIGRKNLMVASTFVVCLSMATAGTFFKVQERHPRYARESLYWLPVVGLSVGTFSYACGLLPVPDLLACELFPTRVRGTAQTVTTVFVGLMYFVCLKSFANIRQAIDISGAFFVYSSVGALGILFAVLVMKESRGDTMR